MLSLDAGPLSSFNDQIAKAVTREKPSLGLEWREWLGSYGRGRGESSSVTLALAIFSQPYIVPIDSCCR
jgi:hypothetical protein